MTWDDLESSLSPAPQFPVQEPDGRRDWAEIDRQATFLSLMRTAAPRVMIRANANAGKRNPRQARREGIKSGVFDLSLFWRAPQIALIEFKGYDGRGRAGKLSRNQIEFGNSCAGLGIPVACFFDPYDAAEWCKSVGFPVAEVRRAA